MASEKAVYRPFRETSVFWVALYVLSAPGAVIPSLFINWEGQPTFRWWAAIGLGVALSSLRFPPRAGAAISVLCCLLCGLDLLILEAMRAVVKLLPLAFLSDGLRQVLTRGAGLTAITGDLLGLLAWTAAGFLLATRTFRWQ